MDQPIMSLQNKISAARRLLAEYKKIADDSAKIYTSSLRKTQIEALEEGLQTQSKLPSGQFLESQIAPLTALTGSVNKATFPISKRMMTPDGMPNYYERIKSEATRGSSKVSIFTAIKETTFGWFR